MAEYPVGGRGCEGRGSDGLEKMRRGRVLNYKQQFGRQKRKGGLVSEERRPLHIHVDCGRHACVGILGVLCLVGAKKVATRLDLCDEALPQLSLSQLFFSISWRIQGGGSWRDVARELGSVTGVLQRRQAFCRQFHSGPPSELDLEFTKAAGSSCQLIV